MQQDNAFVCSVTDVMIALLLKPRRSPVSAPTPAHAARAAAGTEEVVASSMVVVVVVGTKMVVTIELVGAVYRQSEHLTTARRGLA
jgi:hypothetical protein